MQSANPARKKERKGKREEGEGGGSRRKKKKSAQKDSLGNAGSQCGGSWASYPWIRWRAHPCNWNTSRQERHKGRIAKGRVGTRKRVGHTLKRHTVRATVFSVFVMEMDWVAGTRNGQAPSRQQSHGTCMLNELAT